MEDSQAPSPLLSSLLCQEDKSCLNEEFDQLPCYDLDYEEDYIKLLIQKETDTNFGFNSWLNDARLDAIHWILNAQTLMRFRNQTAYLSVKYFDRFLSIEQIDEVWMVRLSAVACLSLAAKMEECKCQVPALSKYQVEGYDFNCRLIFMMELLVLSTSEWKMSLITPFAYLHYFLKTLADKGSKLDELISRAMELIMSILKETNSINHRPSVIAAAAVLAATDWQLTEETLKNKITTTFSWWETSEIHQEQLFACYSLMQRLSPMANFSTPNSIEVHHTSGDTSSTVGTKRRLNFDDCDRSPKIPR